MASPYLGLGLDGDDLGLDFATMTANTAVAESGDRRAFSAAFPTGNLTYDGDVRAAFPRAYLDTDTFPDRTAMTVRTVNSDASLATQLAAAKASGTPSLIVLDDAVTYNAEYTLNTRVGDSAPGGDNVVVFISKAIYDTLPGSSSWVSTVMPPKVTATLADCTNNMARFINVSLANSHQWSVDGATKGWRFIGCYFGVASNVTTMSRLVRVGNGDTTIQTSAALCPENIVFDRCGFDGNATINIKAALELHSKSTAVIDSYFGEGIHHDGQDCKAISSYNGPGPYRIVGCDIAGGSSENVMFGGGTTVCGAPSDIEFRWNKLTKPLTWNASHPTYAGKLWSIKNLFETKKAKYLLIEGCVLRRSWPAAQAGAAMLIKDEVYSDGTAGHTSDVIVRWNKITDVGYGINIAGVSGTAVANVCSYSNLYILGAQYFNAAANPFIGAGHFTNCGTIHDTFVTAGTVNAISQPAQSAGFYALDTIFGRTTYGIKGDSAGEGTQTLATHCPGYDVRGTVFTARPQGSYPAGNYFPANDAAVQFTNAAGGDYSLLGTGQTGSNPPVATSLAITQQPVGAASGSPLSVQPVVQVRDQFGVLITSTVTVTATIASGTATITAGATAVASGGTATFAGLTTTAPATGSSTITFSAPGLAPVTSSAFTTTVAVVTLVPTALQIVQQPGSGTSGVALPTQPVVRVVDQAGNPIAYSVPVTASIGSGGGTITSGTPVTAAGGTATFTALTVTSVSTVTPTFTFTAPGLTPVTSSAVTVAVVAPVGVVAALVVTRQPSGIVTGRPFKVQPIVEARDVNGQRVTTYTGYVTCSVTAGTPQLKGTVRIRCVAGVATYTNLRLVGSGSATLGFSTEG